MNENENIATRPTKHLRGNYNIQKVFFLAPLFSKVPTLLTYSFFANSIEIQMIQRKDLNTTVVSMAKNNAYLLLYFYSIDRDSDASKKL